MSEDYYRLLSADSLINILTCIRKEHPEMSYRKLSALIGLPANRGANLSYFINGRTSDPTLKSLKRYTDMAHEFQKFYTNTVQYNEYIQILKPSKWRDYWMDLSGTPVDFDEFCQDSTVSYQSIHNYVGKKRLAIYPRYMTAVAFTAYTKYRAKQIEEIAKYRKQEPVNFNPMGKKLQDKEKAIQDFWRYKNGA
tara:strand:- start:390 stop:971 length:582 start_codon:yes stop_codon:yes gene_type:complete